MNILALNCGSSSVKYQLFDYEKKRCISSGMVDRIGSNEAVFKHTEGENAQSVQENVTCKDHNQAMSVVLGNVLKALPKGTKIDAVGHRLVHGGSKFARSTRITSEVIATMERLIPLAPLHNPANLAGVRAAIHHLPEVPQVAVFDTAFHQTMPAEAYTYAVPSKWIEEIGVRRYGFHGTSHLYVSRRVAQLLGKPLEQLRVITCHIGNGASITAVKDGKSVDTSMGLTPIEGVIMGTRVGNIDVGIVPYVAAQTNQPIESVLETLNKKSGMLGLTGCNDLRDVEAGNAKGDARCTSALKTYGYAIKKYIGAYSAAMNGVDVIVFTAGVGENSSLVRTLSLSDLGYLGVFLNEEANKTMTRGKEGLISAPHSPVKVAVIHTNEELMIVEDTAAILKGISPSDPNFRYSFENDPPSWKEHAPGTFYYGNRLSNGYHEYPIPVAVSNRHIHLSRADLNVLFGKDYQLKRAKPLSQPGQFAAEEMVTLIGKEGAKIEKVRVLGPERPATQVEISQTDSFKLGVTVPVRDSGDIKGSAGITVQGPKGQVQLSEGCILSVRHIHMHTDDAKYFNVKEKDRVRVRTSGNRNIVFENVLVRVSDKFALEMHIDTDEANAALIKSGDKAVLCVD